MRFIKSRTSVSAITAFLVVAFAIPAMLSAAGEGPRPKSRLGDAFRSFFGLSKEDVEKFEFSKKYVNSTFVWKMRRSKPEVLLLLRQRANFVLQNSPDALSEFNAKLIIGITDEMGIGDGDSPPEDPPPEDPPEEPPADEPPAPEGPTMVVPGQPDQSPLVLRVEGKLQPAMPLGRPLPRAQAMVFRAWVQAGATEEMYRRTVRPVVKAACVFCHTRKTAGGNLSLQYWPDIAGRIAAPKSHSGK